MKLSRRAVILLGGVLIGLAVIGRILAQPPGAQEIAVDTTGASAGEIAVVGTESVPPPGAAPTPEILTADAGTPVPSDPELSATTTPVPPAVQVAGNQITTTRDPLILLNPSTVRVGSSIGVSGSGFDPGATLDLVIKRDDSDGGEAITFVQLDQNGGFGGVSVAVPEHLPSGSFILEARQRGGEGQAKVAQATGTVASSSPQVTLGTQVGKPGDMVEVSAAGFAPDEAITVHWNNLGTEPITTVQTDAGGNVAQASFRVPFGAVGDNAVIFVGEQSQSPVTSPFLMLTLFPTATLSSYAIKPDNVITYTGSDFGPDERILVYLNSPTNQPITTIQAGTDGTFTATAGFLVPFGLSGQQTLIFIGERSQAPATASFDILPYTPTVQPSTYGGRPGTVITFYGFGFARSEVVHIYVDRTAENPGRLVSCFLTDGEGNVAASGEYMIGGDRSAGQLMFTFVGNKSGATTTTAVEVMPSDIPVQVPASTGEFTCPHDDAGALPEQHEVHTSPPIPPDVGEPEPAIPAQP